MVRRAACVVFAVVLLCSLGIQAIAAEDGGQIYVTLAGQAEAAGNVVMLYRVGDQIPEGYRLTDAFGGGIIWEQDALSTQLAQWLAGMDVGPGLTQTADESGVVAYTGLEKGLYLIMQVSPEDYAVLPFLAKLPYEGRWQVRADLDAWELVAEAPKTSQHPAPILGAMGMVLAGIGLALCAGRRRKQ